MDFCQRVALIELDHDPDGWPAIQTWELSAAVNEIQRLRERLEEREWKPIETAPKGGTQILALVNGKIAVCEWMRVLGGDFHWFRHDVGGWRLSNPTHWMPLPAPPAAGQEDA